MYSYFVSVAYLLLYVILCHRKLYTNHFCFRWNFRSSDVTNDACTVYTVHAQERDSLQHLTDSNHQKMSVSAKITVFEVLFFLFFFFVLSFIFLISRRIIFACNCGLNAAVLVVRVLTTLHTSECSVEKKRFVVCGFMTFRICHRHPPCVVLCHTSSCESEKKGICFNTNKKRYFTN